VIQSDTFYLVESVQGSEFLIEMLFSGVLDTLFLNCGDQGAHVGSFSDRCGNHGMLQSDSDRRMKSRCMLSTKCPGLRGRHWAPHGSGRPDAIGVRTMLFGSNRLLWWQFHRRGTRGLEPSADRAHGACHAGVFIEGRRKFGCG